MKSLANVLTEISVLTNRIRENYPELYELLEENKVTIEAVGTTVTGDEFAEYLEAMKEKLQHYIENHEKQPVA